MVQRKPANSCYNINTSGYARIWVVRVIATTDCLRDNDTEDLEGSRLETPKDCTVSTSMFEV